MAFRHGAFVMVAWGFGVSARGFVMVAWGFGASARGFVSWWLRGFGRYGSRLSAT